MTAAISFDTAAMNVREIMAQAQAVAGAGGCEANDHDRLNLAQTVDCSFSFRVNGRSMVGKKVHGVFEFMGRHYIQ